MTCRRRTVASGTHSWVLLLWRPLGGKRTRASRPAGESRMTSSWAFRQPVLLCTSTSRGGENRRSAEGNRLRGTDLSICSLQPPVAVSSPGARAEFSVAPSHGRDSLFVRIRPFVRQGKRPSGRALGLVPGPAARARRHRGHGSCTGDEPTPRWACWAHLG